MTKRTIVRNSDNDLLLPMGVLGSVDEVNGPGAAEIPDFVPTRHELLQLVNFWVKETLGYEFYETFLFAQYCSSGSRLSAYAWHRINRIGELLGEERAEKAVEEAYAEFGKDKNPRDWEIFMHGDDADWKALQDEIQREHFQSREKGECPENE